MQIQLLTNECCGNGQCVEIAPNVFRLDPRRKAMVLDADAAPVERRSRPPKRARARRSA